MFYVSCEIDFCYGHRLLNYQGKCRHLHGHNGRMIVTIEAAGLDGRGMVLDFGEIKAVISRWIDENLDHRMILSCRSRRGGAGEVGRASFPHRRQSDGGEHRQGDFRLLPRAGVSRS